MEKLAISVEEDKDKNAHILRMAGTVDVFSYKELKEYLDTWVEKDKPLRILVDMEKVSYVGSSGWSVLFLQATTQEKAGGMLVMFNMNDRVKRALDMIMPKKRGIQTAGNLEEALALLN